MVFTRTLRQDEKCLTSPAWELRLHNLKFKVPTARGLNFEVFKSGWSIISGDESNRGQGQDPGISVAPF